MNNKILKTFILSVSNFSKVWYGIWALEINRQNYNRVLSLDPHVESKRNISDVNAQKN